jgi:hypothetical protein
VLRFLRVSVSPRTFGNKLVDSYLANSFKLEEGFMQGLAGEYSPEQLKAVRGEIGALIALAHESAVRQHVKPQFQAQVLEHLDLHLASPDVGAYRGSSDVGTTFMTRCGFVQNAYIRDVGNAVFDTARSMVIGLIKGARIEEGGM